MVKASALGQRVVLLPTQSIISGTQGICTTQSRINSTMILHIHFDELKFRGSSFREANSAVGLKGSPAGTTMTLDSASGSCVHNSHTHTQLSTLEGSVSPVLALYHHNVTLGCHGTLA